MNCLTTIKSYLLLFFLFLFYTASSTSINVGGTITSSVTWNTDTVFVVSNITINNGVVLNITPGTTVLFNGHYHIYSKGAIKAYGTSGSLIVFKSVNTTIGWDGIQIDSPSSYNDSTVFSYCKFEYANRNIPSSTSLGGAALSLSGASSQYGKIRVSNSSFSYNKCTGHYYYASASAISIKNFTQNQVRITDNTFYSNQSSKSTLYIVGGYCYIKGNQLYSNTNSGSAIDVYYGDCDIISNIIANNTGGSGGGVRIWYTWSQKSNIVNNIIVNNTATYRGGGIYLQAVKPNIINNTICNNQSNTLLGGGISFNQNSDAKLVNNIIYGNKSNGGSVSNQVGIIDVSSDPSIENCDIQGGVSAFSGAGSGVNYLGIYLNNTDVTPGFVSPSSGSGTSYNGLTANWKISQGAAIINKGYKNSALLNIPTTDFGGFPRVTNGRIDIGAYENQDPVIAGCSISSNTVWDADTIHVGCNVSISSGATLTINPGTVVLFSAYNNISVQGRLIAQGIPSERITFMIDDTTGFYNKAISNGSWDGIDFINTPLTNDSSRFSYCNFSYAKAIGSVSYGGAMVLKNYSKVIIENCNYSNNSASYYGGALYIKSSNIKFNNNIVANNYSERFGGGLWIEDCVMDFYNNTIVNNAGGSTNSSGGGIFLWYSTVEIANCIFWGNICSYSTYYSQIGSQGSALSKIYNSDIQYGQAKVGQGTQLAVYLNNMNINPMFINPSAGPGLNYDGLSADWSLGPNTSMVDAGLYNSVTTSFDIAGNPRLVSDSIDIGAYEVQLSPKFITQNPISKSVCAGTAASFSMGTTINVDYQWVHNGVNINGANASTYMDMSSSILDTGYYYCIMSTPYGSLKTDSARYDILYPPAITTTPSTNAVCMGDSTSFTISASGSQPMVFDWQNTYGQLASSAVVGASTIGSQNLSNSANGYPSSFAGYFRSDKYQFIIRASELNNAGVSTGNIQSIAFNVLSVNSCPPLSNYALKMKATTASSLSPTFITNLTTVYSIASFQAIQGWNTIQFQTPFYWDGTSNIVFEITSNNPNVVNAGNASIAYSNTSYVSSNDYHANISDVKNQISGTTFSKRPVLQIRAGSSLPIYYYAIDSVLASNASVYRCNVSNICGSVLSIGAQLTVNNVPSVVPIIGAANICESQSYTYTTSATGTSPISYQWYRDGAAISGSTSISHSISSASSSDDGIYYCKATNACGDDSSNQSVMSIKLLPNITSQPTASQTLCANQSTSLSVSATGYYPITYQWYKAGAPVGGATTPNYYMSPINISDAGIYKCVATNTCGNDQSNNVTIAVNSPPSITYQSADSSRCEGDQMSFDLLATGTAPLNYQWYKGTTLISGANANNYFLSNLGVSNSGAYHCAITNSCATINSSNKNLIVNANPQVSLGNDTSFCLGGSTTIGPGYGYFCLWNNGSYNNQLTVTNTGSYFVNVTDQNGCSAVSDTLNVMVLSPYSNQEICIVTIDSASGKNAVVWSKTPSQSIASFNIYKESTVSGVYNIIANQAYDSLSVIIDNTSSPLVKPERYVITVVDSCGNESSISMSHRTMHLTVNKGQNNDWNLIWNAYEGFTPSSYKIYRADTSLSFVNIATVAGSSSYTYLYTDQTATAGIGYYYYIEVVHPSGGCSVTKGKTSYNSSRSNRANNGKVNPSSLVPAFFGTPTSGVFPLNVHFFDQSQGNPIEWEWDFGDGNVDSIQNPVHSYTQIGVYSVSLIVRDAGSMNSVAFQNYITVLTTGIAEVGNEFVVKVFPNPYSDKTNIAYALTNQTKVVLEVYTAQGQKVAQLINAEQSAGSYKVQFRAADYGFASGVYILRMHVGDQLITKKMVEVK